MLRKVLAQRRAHRFVPPEWAVLGFHVPGFELTAEGRATQAFVEGAGARVALLDAEFGAGQAPDADPPLGGADQQRADPTGPEGRAATELPERRRRWARPCRRCRRPPPGAPPTCRPPGGPPRPLRRGGSGGPARPPAWGSLAQPQDGRSASVRLRTDRCSPISLIASSPPSDKWLSPISASGRRTVQGLRSGPGRKPEGLVPGPGPGSPVARAPQAPGGWPFSGSPVPAERPTALFGAQPRSARRVVVVSRVVARRARVTAVTRTGRVAGWPARRTVPIKSRAAIWFTARYQSGR